MKRKIFSLLVLLTAAATGAWAQTEVTVNWNASTNSGSFTMPGYDVELTPHFVANPTFDETADNADELAGWNGYEADVTVKRTLVAGSWNTFALPFSLASIPSGWTVKELSSTSLNDGTLTLNFTNALSIEAGKPYLVKVTTNANLSSTPFMGAMVSATAQPFTSADVDFIPTLGKTTITGDNAKNVLFVAAGNTLKNPTALPADMKGFRAYFQLKGAAANQARAFKLNLDESDATGVRLMDDGESKMDNSVYNLQGRKVENGKSVNRKLPKGVYIVQPAEGRMQGKNGKKVVIK